MNDKKKIKVSDRCTGCGTCILMFPEIFDWNSEGKAYCKVNEAVEEEVVRDVIPICPEGAIEAYYDVK